MKIKYAFEPVDMGEEIILVPVGAGSTQVSGVLKLNKEGLEIVNLLTEDTSINQIVDRLAAKYDNDRNVLNGWVTLVTNALQQAGLLDD